MLIIFQNDAEKVMKYFQSKLKIRINFKEKNILKLRER